MEGLQVAQEQSTVPELLHLATFENADEPAVVFEQRQLTFRQLDQLANQFAHALIHAGVEQGDRVGLCIDRCPEAIAAMLGVFKVGAAFVPLDPEYPVDRIQFMIEDAAIAVLITHDKASNPLAVAIQAQLELTWIDSCAIEFAELPSHWDAAMGPAARPQDLAYIMYTSGSTGKPKGVQIEHAALTAYCLADIEAYRLTKDDRTLQFSTLNFDIAIEEIFPPLLIGSCVVVRPSQRSSSANELSQIVHDYSITAVHLATAYWHEWVDLMRARNEFVPDSLRLVIATGEKVSVEHYRRWKELCRHDVLWCNAYGPTETTVTATVFVPEAEFAADIMPIGVPLPGYSAYILNDSMHPVGPGETGQLFIGGPALARGYLNRPDLTEAAFLAININDESTRLYRTGDLARWLPDGNIDFAGRIDHQIKLGSYRIEPGEIEAEINRFPAVQESLVLYEQVGTQKFLVAYVASKAEEFSIVDLANYLQEHLPPYMVPPRYCVVETFPKTINGKIDRQALPPASASRAAANLNYQAPRNDLERRLAAIWKEVLQVPEVGVHDDFFALGGSSLLVTRIVAELAKDLDVELPVRDFFANPTLASSAQHIASLLPDEECASKSPAAVDLAVDGLRRREGLPLVEPQFLEHGNRRLFAVHYRPRCSEKWPMPKKHGIVLCNSLGHEYTRAYRNLQQLAVMLCCEGYDVLRFDYYGTGNSNGKCGNLRLESLQADLRIAREFLSRQPEVETTSLMGIRIGATLAAASALDDPVEKLVLWDPVCDGRLFLRTLEDFHQYALNSQTRFARVVENAAPGQLYGHAWCADKRASFTKLKLLAGSESSHLLVTSADYLRDEQAQAFVQDWNHVATDDEIYWHHPEVAESAFASGDANRKILDFFRAG